MSSIPSQMLLQKRPEISDMRVMSINEFCSPGSRQTHDTARLSPRLLLISVAILVVASTTPDRRVSTTNIPASKQST
ncbi:hypothetical protein SISSUDRAFT_1042460 [Sistotremastrum suecicum HHB10207 ss-3]|uniref:Uncharacterized protein n=1 Tax=Sistotremastrum suecicum HHB10207 ss-3 TaxID=1314776 RepID=A0A166GH64_9AGAM|nr:hypothetical protein SISSUDRAFT_1042460 [Sistotremastrum suecicum HHB10207 ss-3]